MTAALPSLLQASQSLGGFSGHGFTLLFATTFKGTIFLLLAVASALALRRASAAMRHMVWTLALAALLALPIASLIAPVWNVPMISLSPTNTRREPTMMSEDFAAASRDHQVLPDHGVRPSAATAREATTYPAWLGWLLSLWAIGLMLLAARIAVGEVRVRRLVRHSQLFKINQAKSILENVRLCLHKSRVAEVRISAEIGIPFTWGTSRPTILLPAEACQWSRKQLEFVLAHEVAHVNRFDYLTQMLAQMICALFWFHPLVWLAAFEMRKERERACDDRVLSLGHEATDYAEFLVALGRGLRRAVGLWSTSVAMAQSSQLEVRMKALLDPKLNHKPLAASHVLLAAALAVALLLPTAAIRATAKNATGNISGTVHDPSGAVIPGANVALINLETLHSIVAHTGEDGAFEFSAVPAGRYQLEITKPGFTATKSAELDLKPSSDLHQWINMHIGSVTMEIHVRGLRPNIVPNGGSGAQEVHVWGHKPGAKLPTPPSGPRRIRVGGLVEAAKAIYLPRPIYPASAEKQGIEGTVVLQAVIGTSGQILSLSPNSGPDPALIKAAMNAVRQWRYQPTLLNGVPVEVETTIKVVFQLIK